MPQRQGKCINFGLCTMADSREAITLPEGEDFSCPECGKMLSEVEGKGGGAGAGGGGKSKLALAAVAVALLAVGGYFLLSPDKPQPDPVPTPGPVKTQPDPGPTPGPVKTQPDPGPTPGPVKTQPDPGPIPGPVKNPDEPQVKKPVDRTVKKPIEHTVKNPVDPIVKNPDTEPEVKEVKEVKAEPAQITPSSGTIVWEGTAKKGELISIENGIADKGVIVSGKLPGVPVLIAPLNTKKVAIAGAPGPDSRYQRIVLRIQGNGPMKVELSWSVVP